MGSSKTENIHSQPFPVLKKKKREKDCLGSTVIIEIITGGYFKRTKQNGNKDVIWHLAVVLFSSF